MIHALGISVTSFDPANPGRLCRGRERWIEGYPIDVSGPIHRVVISGARFSDDSARDAARGLSFSMLSAGEVLQALFPGRVFLAFREQGEVGHTPESAILVETHVQPRYGGRVRDNCVRWRARADDAATLSDLVGDGPGAADGFIPFEAGGELSAEVEQLLFLLTGYSERLSVPERRFQPAALQELLAIVPFVVCVHLDKHASVLGIYAREPIDCTGLERLAVERGVLVVPFTIPPMLARWDRALYELRLAWRGDNGAEFPVPPGDRGGHRDLVASYEREE